ncbi:MAG: hypothetical protein RLZZ164_1170 [Actinomycetota bacterium]|jgi:uncharacterized protein YdhG (YjbR/CyaY superfamily)
MNDIADYNKTLGKPEREIALALEAIIKAKLPKAEGKVWHGHPVWFLDGNPIVGYSLKKAGLELLFWSGQSFQTAGLRAIGKFKAAGIGFASIDDLNAKQVEKWMREAKSIQWDYANLAKLRKLDKLTDF